MARVLCKNCKQLYDPTLNPTRFGFGTATYGYHCSYHPKDPEKEGHSLGARDDYVDVWKFPCCGKTLIGAVINGKDLPPPICPGCKNGPHEPDESWADHFFGMRPDSDGSGKSPLVFLSFNYRDIGVARNIYDFLSDRGKNIFFSAITLQKTSKADFVSEIHAAIDAARHLIVTCSDAKNCTSGWVQSETNMFLNELRSGHKDGNVVVVTTPNVKSIDLPIALRQWHVFNNTPEGLASAAEYLF